MISPLLDLETRRKILFADDYFTIRSLGTDTALITFTGNNTPRESFENAHKFFNGLDRPNLISSLIVDVSYSRTLKLTDVLSLGTVQPTRLHRLAIASKKLTHRLAFPLLKVLLPSVNLKLFKDISKAIAWAKAST